MDKINRLRAMALEALHDYEAALNAGGEPKYPDWADDMLDVCDRAEANSRPRAEQRPIHSRNPALV